MAKFRIFLSAFIWLTISGLYDSVSANSNCYYVFSHEYNTYFILFTSRNLPFSIDSNCSYEFQFIRANNESEKNQFCSKFFSLVYDNHTDSFDPCKIYQLKFEIIIRDSNGKFITQQLLPFQYCSDGKYQPNPDSNLFSKETLLNNSHYQKLSFSAITPYGVLPMSYFYSASLKQMINDLSIIPEIRNFPACLSLGSNVSFEILDKLTPALRINLTIYDYRKTAHHGLVAAGGENFLFS